MGDKVIEQPLFSFLQLMGKSSYANRNDLAAAGAVILTTQDHENKVYEFVGPVSYSFYDIAGILIELSPKTIQYFSPSSEVYSEQFKGYGVAYEAVYVAASFCVAGTGRV